MKLELSRRDLFLAGGGAVAGIALSPVPWKLLDDLSIWTQQPPTPTPRPAGPLAFRFTSCALCPAACGLKARCFGAQPVGFAAVPGHPASDGGLCPLGLTAHHLAKHPLRATHPERLSGGKRERIDRATAVATLSAALAACGKDPKRTFAVVDGRPGRSLSRTYRALAAATGGLYVTPPAAGAALSLEALAKRFDGGALALGVDTSKARRVVSFGTPVLTDAGTPGLLARQRAESRRRPAAERIEVIQVEATRGRSAALADRYIPIAPGTEAAFALGLAHVLLDEKLADTAFLDTRTTGWPTSPAWPPASPRPSSSRRPASRPASSRRWRATSPPTARPSSSAATRRPRLSPGRPRRRSPP
ncbi:MAG: molybdopterin-dependent oxidoreductase [Holophagales bacterium]|nr:molybdopterin-dependent oxidoreductase [Holophagales bacterium]